MKYSTEEALDEIEKRSRKIRKAEEKKKGMLLSAVTFSLSLGLILVIGAFGGAGSLAGAGSAYGSFFIAAEYGGYVLTAIIAFVAGVAVTLFIRNCQKRAGEKKKDEDETPG